MVLITQYIIVNTLKLLRVRGYLFFNIINHFKNTTPNYNLS